MKAAPLPDWVRGYERTWLRGDVLAGVTVTAYLIPQVMAYAEVAGVPPEAALWAVVGGLTVYVVVGSSRQLSVGPESTTSLMTATALGSLVAVGDDRVPLAAALALMVGVFCLVGWVLRLGALADLLSRPVLVGYLAGIAFTMAASQLGKLVGVTEDASSFVDEVREVVTHLGDLHAPTATLGLTTLAVLLTLSHFFPRAPVALIGMLGATAVVWLFDLRDRGIVVVGDIPAGLPVPGLPDVAAQDLIVVGRARRGHRVRRLHRQHPHRPRVRVSRRDRRSTRSESCSPSAAPTSAPVSSAASPSAAAAAGPRSATPSASAPSSAAWSPSSARSLRC